MSLDTLRIQLATWVDTVLLCTASTIHLAPKELSGYQTSSNAHLDNGVCERHSEDSLAKKKFSKEILDPLPEMDRPIAR